MEKLGGSDIGFFSEVGNLINNPLNEENENNVPLSGVSK